MQYLLSLVYIAAICAANASVSAFGPVVTPLNAFLLIGLDFVVRDKLHEHIGLVRMLLLVLAAGAISFAINPAADMIAIASVAAFVLAATVDTAVYQMLIKRPWLVKSNTSNVFASAADSLVFPAIAFGALTPWVVLGQFFAKVFGGAVWSWLLRGVK